MTLETPGAFLRFCKAADWIPKNLATRTRPPKVEDKPTLPLSDEDLKKAP